MTVQEDCMGSHRRCKSTENFGAHPHWALWELVYLPCWSFVSSRSGRILCPSRLWTSQYAQCEWETPKMRLQFVGVVLQSTPLPWGVQWLCPKDGGERSLGRRDLVSAQAVCFCFIKINRLVSYLYMSSRCSPLLATLRAMLHTSWCSDLLLVLNIAWLRSSVAHFSIMMHGWYVCRCLVHIRASVALKTSSLCWKT